MVVIPAIDLFGGKCVRLTKGDYQKPTVYSDEPLDVVDEFLQARAEHIHVVDLDAARGTGDNKAVIESIVGRHDLKVQVAGGIWTAGAGESWGPACAPPPRLGPSAGPGAPPPLERPPRDSPTH